MFGNEERVSSMSSEERGFNSEWCDFWRKCGYYVDHWSKYGRYKKKKKVEENGKEEGRKRLKKGLRKEGRRRKEEERRE